LGTKESLIMVDLEQFKGKLQSFPRDYMTDFDGFWKWKLKVETKNKHILQDVYRKETGDRLCGILRKWQAYRPYGLREEILRDSLGKISSAYGEIRQSSLLEFNRIPDEPLNSIWHELGHVKEEHGNKNDIGNYSVVSVCKPLMLLWGQTLAFDSRTRSGIPSEYCVPVDYCAPKYAWRWTFAVWKSVMTGFQRGLSEDSEAVNYFRQLSGKRYGTHSIVPYGRFLDIYYF